MEDSTPSQPNGLANEPDYLSNEATKAIFAPLYRRPKRHTERKPMSFTQTTRRTLLGKSKHHITHKLELVYLLDNQYQVLMHVTEDDDYYGAQQEFTRGFDETWKIAFDFLTHGCEITIGSSALRDFINSHTPEDM